MEMSEKPKKKVENTDSANKAMSLSNTLKEFLLKGEDWERRQTNVAGVYIIRLPATKTRPASIGIEVNPFVGGSPTKRRGLPLLTMEEFNSLREAIEDNRTKTLMSAIEAISGSVPRRTTGGGIIEL